MPCVPRSSHILAQRCLHHTSLRNDDCSVGAMGWCDQFAEAGGAIENFLQYHSAE